MALGGAGLPGTDRTLPSGEVWGARSVMPLHLQHCRSVWGPVPRQAELQEDAKHKNPIL